MDSSRWVTAATTLPVGPQLKAAAKHPARSKLVLMFMKEVSNGSTVCTAWVVGRRQAGFIRPEKLPPCGLVVRAANDKARYIEGFFTVKAQPTALSKGGPKSPSARTSPRLSTTPGNCARRVTARRAYKSCFVGLLCSRAGDAQGQFNRVGHFILRRFWINAVVTALDGKASPDHQQIALEVGLVHAHPELVLQIG